MKPTTPTVPILFVMFNGYFPSTSFLGTRNVIEVISQPVTLQFLFLPKYSRYTLPFLVLKKFPVMVIGSPATP